MALTKGFFRGSITRPQHLEEEEIELTRPCYKREISDSVKPSKNVSYTREFVSYSLNARIPIFRSSLSTAVYRAGIKKMGPRLRESRLLTPSVREGRGHAT